MSGEIQVQRMRLGAARSMERARNEDGKTNRTSVVQLAEYLILRSRKRRNSGEPEGSVRRDSQSGYDLHPITGPFSRPSPSITDRTPKKDRRRMRVRDRTINNLWMGEFSLSRQTIMSLRPYTIVNRTYNLLKRITGLNSLSTTGKRRKNMIRSS